MDVTVEIASAQLPCVFGCTGDVGEKADYFGECDEEDNRGGGSTSDAMETEIVKAVDKDQHV